MLIDKSDNDDLLAKAYMKDSLYWLTNATPELPTERANIAKHSDNVVIIKWHNRLAHLGKKKISQMIRDNLLKTNTLTEKSCQYCASGKQARDPFR